MFQAYYLKKYFDLNPITMFPLIAIYLVFTVIFVLSKLCSGWDTFELRKFIFMYFVLGQCIISKIIHLAWVKLDAEIMCTLNEYRLGYFVESN